MRHPVPSIMRVKPSSWFATALLPVVLAGCVSTARPVREQAANPGFDPVVFFAGRTEGKGMLKIAFHKPVATLVEGRGQVIDGGAIRLDQTVRRGTQPATSRFWQLRPLGDGRYAGTLTDAAGPVVGDVIGNRLHLAFTMKGGLHADQWLYLRPGGTIADNVMVIRKFGLPVARLDETITNPGPG